MALSKSILVLFLLGIAILILSCSGSKNSKNEEIDDIFILTQQKPQYDHMEALISTKPALLSIDNGGCIKVKEHTIIWPYGFELIKTGDKITIVDDKGNFTAEVGDFIQLSGGECSDCTQEEILRIVGVNTENKCSGPYWIVGKIIK